MTPFRPIVSKRVAQPAHADDWLLTYADMITLLLCFFAIIVTVTVAKKDSSKTPPQTQIEQSVEQGQPIPIIQRQETKALSEPQVTSDLPGVFPDKNLFHPLTAADFPPERVPDPTFNPTLLKADEPPPEVIAPPPVVPLLAVADLPSIPPVIAGLKPQGAEIQQKGDRLTSIEMNSGAFFDSGSATLSVPGRVILQSLALKLKSPQFEDYRITVEGHTDDQPIHTAQFPSNWELSTSRAAAVVQFLITQGVSAEKLRAAGYAETMPKVPNRDTEGKPIPENQAQNRRVVIELEKIDKNQ